MGKRGPRPTPSNILKLRGSSLATNKRAQSEVQGPDGTPDCPDWLDDNAKSHWAEIVPMLEGMGVLTRIDGVALSRYCRLWSRWRAAEAFIDKSGDVYTIRDEAGKARYLQQFPQVAIAHRLALQLTKLEAEFGMTPSARSRIQLAPKVEDRRSDKSRFFQAG